MSKEYDQKAAERIVTRLVRALVEAKADVWRAANEYYPDTPEEDRVYRLVNLQIDKGLKWLKSQAKKRAKTRD